MRRGERGFTIVEAVVAALLIAIGIGAVISAFPVFHRQTVTSQREEVAATVAERELENMATTPWNNLVMTARAPAGAPGTVSGGTFTSDSGAVPAEPMCDPYSADNTLADCPSSTGSATVAPGPTPFSQGSISGTIYRYITWKDEACVNISGLNLPDALTNQLTTALNLILGLLSGGIDTLLENAVHAQANVLCGGSTHNAKRLTVAVQLNVPTGQGGPMKPVFMSTLVIDPGQGKIDVGS